MKKLSATLSLLCLLAAGAPAWAGNGEPAGAAPVNALGEEPETPSESAEAELLAPPPATDELAARIDALEKKTTTWSKIVANLPKISGYAQLGYQWDNGYTLGSQGLVDNGKHSSFSVMSVRLNLAGEIGRKFDYRIQLEFASVKLIDAYIRYKLHPAFSLQAGQFHTNFSLEGPFGALDMEALTYAPVVSVIAGTPDSRDIGIAAYGAAGKREGFNLFEYSLGVFNGEGKNKADANKSKDIITRIKINPVKDLTLSGSFSYGELGADYVHNTRYAGGIWYHGDSFWARSEYLGLRQKHGATYHVDGAYVTLGSWNAKKTLGNVLRYSYMDNGLGGTYVTQHELLVGYDYKPIKHLRVQLNYSHSWFKDGADCHNNNIVGVAVTGIF